VNLSIRHSAQITRGCGLLSASHAHRPGRALNYRCHNHLLRHFDLRSLRSVLLSLDLDAFIALISGRTSFPMRQHQKQADAACTLETHRGLTAHEEADPPGEVFGDDE
jgi:hypothetical protein